MKRLLTGAFALLLSIAAGATTLNPIQLLNPAGSSSGQAIVSTGTSSAPAWGGVGLNGIAAISGNTLIGNATNASATPTAVPVSNCVGTSSALNYTSGTGFSCNGSINALTVSGSAIGTSGGTIPLLSGANTWSGAQTFSALITPSSTIGIRGTAGNDNAQSGSIGEYASNTTTATPMTTAVVANAASVTLTAGDWDVTGTVTYTPAASTTISNLLNGISTTSGTLGPAGTTVSMSPSWTTGTVETIAAPTVRVSLSATTTVYLVARASFGVSTMTCDGFIRARRVR